MLPHKFAMADSTKDFKSIGILYASLTGNPNTASKPIFRPLVWFWTITTLQATTPHSTRWWSESSISSDSLLHILEKKPSAVAKFTVVESANIGISLFSYSVMSPNHVVNSFLWNDWILTQDCPSHECPPHPAVRLRQTPGSIFFW